MRNFLCINIESDPVWIAVIVLVRRDRLPAGRISFGSIPTSIPSHAKSRPASPRTIRQPLRTAREVDSPPSKLPGIRVTVADVLRQPVSPIFCRARKQPFGSLAGICVRNAARRWPYHPHFDFGGGLGNSIFCGPGSAAGARRLFRMGQEVTHNLGFTLNVGPGRMIVAMPASWSPSVDLCEARA